MFVQIKYLTLQAVLSSSAALLLITKVLCLQRRKGWFALQERFHVLLLVDESFRLDALSSSKNTLKEVGCNQYLKITLNEKGSLFSRVYGLFTAPVKKEEAHRPVSKFPFKPLLCVLKGFRFFFSLSVTQAKHCPWERLSYMSATCCSYRRYFCPLRTTGSPPRLPLILPSLSHASSPCAPYGVSTPGQASSPSGEV